MNKNVEQYADQCAVFKMKNKSVTKTLSAAAHLQVVDEKNEGDSSLPLDVFGSFSRIQLTLIEKGADTLKTPTCNLTVDEVDFIAKRMEIAMNFTMQNALVPSKEESEKSNSSPAYTVKFAMGSFRGKTPAEIGDKEKLLKQKEFLASNLSQYPANQTIIDAIDDAVRMIDEGTLKCSSGETQPRVSTAISIYEAGNKTRSSVKDEKGNVLVTDIKINYDASRNYPIEVVLHNCYAPLIKDKSDRQNIELSKAVSHESASVNMSMFDFYTFISNCKRTCDLFAQKNAGEAFRLMQKYVWKPDKNKGKVPENKSPEKIQAPDEKKKDNVPSAEPKPSKKETKVFVFNSKAKVVDEGDNFSVAVAIEGFNHTGKLLVDKSVAQNLTWWNGFVAKAAADGVHNFKAMATREEGIFTYVSLAG